MTISNTYWDTSKPVDGLLIPDIPQSDRYILSTVKGTLENEHHTFASDSTDGGYHSQGSAVAFYQSGDPETRGDGSSFAAADLGRIWIDSDDMTVYILTATTPTWTEIAVPSTISESAPTLTLINTDAEDGDGERESRYVAKGTQTGSEETTLGYLEFSHEGAADDEKGQCRIVLNDGDDSDTPSKVAAVFMSTGLIDGSESVCVSTDTGLAEDSDDQIASQKAIKAYVDGQISAIQDPAYTGGESHTFDGGLIIKAGKTAHSGSADKTITFGSAFPNAIVCVTITSQVSQNDISVLELQGAPTTSGFVVATNQANYLQAIHWIAIGY